MGRWATLALLIGIGLLLPGGCSPEADALLPNRQRPAGDTEGQTLLARFVHVSDTHVVDTLSPARFAGAQMFTRSAWRPYEAYSMQIVDGIVRAVNRMHAGGRTIDFVLHTGDACDNAQTNELAWLLTLLDGGIVNPLSGPDDRAVDLRPPLDHDPYAVFAAQGLYRAGRDGDADSIPWYAVFGNHDVYAIGVLPIFEDHAGHRTAPLPLDTRRGLLLPVRLDPVGSAANGRVTPAYPGPPDLFSAPAYVAPNPRRAYFDQREYVAALRATRSGPRGHGFSDVDGPTWYSVSPVPGVRLIGLDTTDRASQAPGYFYQDGALSRAQLEFLRAELEGATQRGETVIVASHHPSATLLPVVGSEVTPDELREVLNAYPAVVVHQAGHSHRNRVTDRGGYVEIETCSTLDPPQEARVVELWRDDADGGITVAYDVFSHLDETWPPLGADPLRALRAWAHKIAQDDKEAAARQRVHDPSGESPWGTEADRNGRVVLRR